MNIVMFETTIRQDKEGRYCLNDLHKAAGGESKHQPSNWLRLDNTQAMIEEIDRSSEVMNALNVQQGGKNQGTYVCKELVYSYAMWISPKFNLYVIRTFDEMISSEQQRIYERQAARLEFPGMTQALLESRTEQGKKTSFFHYSNEVDMINKIVTGYTAKKLREKLGIDSNESLREYLTETQITAIGYLQRTNTTLIEEGYSFEDRKQKLTERFEKKFSANVKQEFDEKLMLLNF